LRLLPLFYTVVVVYHREKKKKDAKRPLSRKSGRSEPKSIYRGL